MAPSPQYDFSSLVARLRSAPKAPAADQPPSGARAAVAAILRDRGPDRDAEILFILRAEREGDPWSGHMAFPGGRRDAADADMLATAVRETREEVGIELDARTDLLAELPVLQAVSRSKRVDMGIAPFVFGIRGDAELAVDSVEVAATFWAPIGPLVRREGAGLMPYVYEGSSIDLPFLPVQGRVVWGLTHRMLQMLFEALFDIAARTSSPPL